VLVHVLSAILIGFVLQAPPRITGSMKVIVTAVADSIPVGGALVSLSYQMPHNTGRQSPLEVAKKKTDQNGEAFFADLPPGKYWVMVLVGNNRRTGIYTGSQAMVYPDSIATVEIPLRQASIQGFDVEPEYREDVFLPDTTMDERMPIYNPEENNNLRQDSLRD